MKQLEEEQPFLYAGVGDIDHKKYSIRYDVHLGLLSQQRQELIEEIRKSKEEKGENMRTIAKYLGYGFGMFGIAGYFITSSMEFSTHLLVTGCFLLLVAEAK